MSQRSRRRTTALKTPAWLPTELLERIGELTHDPDLAREARKDGARWAEALDALIAANGGVVPTDELERPLELVISQHGIARTALSLLRGGYPMPMSLPAVRRLLAEDVLQPVLETTELEAHEDEVETDDEPRAEANGSDALRREREKVREKDRKLREERESHAKTRSELTSQRDQALHRVAELERQVAAGPSDHLVDDLRAAHGEANIERRLAEQERDRAIDIAAAADESTARLRAALAATKRELAESRATAERALSDLRTSADAATGDRLLRIARQIGAAAALRLDEPRPGDAELLEALAGLARWSRAATVTDEPLTVTMPAMPARVAAGSSSERHGGSSSSRAPRTPLRRMMTPARVTVVAGGGLGGSSFLLEHAGARILLDCGLPPNRIAELPIDIDLAILTHAHADHMQGLPHLLRQRPEIRVICTKPTKRLAMDQANAIDEFISGDRVLVRDADETYRVVGGAVELTLHRVAHCLGSCAVRLRFADGFSLLYTGDLGGTGLRTLRPADPLPVTGVDAILLESTLGDRDPPRRDVEMTLLRDMAEVVSGGGCVVLPTASLGRAQELAALLAEGMTSGVLPKAPVMMSALARRILDRYRRSDHDGWLNDIAFPETETLRPEDDPNDLVSKPRYLIVGGAAGGDGRSGQIVLAAAQRAECGVFFTSFSGSAARNRMPGDVHTIRLDDGTTQSATIVSRWEWVSSPDHPSGEELVAAVARADPRVPLLLVHGVAEAKRHLEERLKAAGHTDVRKLNDGDVVELVRVGA